MLAGLACAPRRLACRYGAGRVALRENRAHQHHPAGPGGSEAARPKINHQAGVRGPCGGSVAACVPGVRPIPIIRGRDPGRNRGPVAPRSCNRCNFLRRPDRHGLRRYLGHVDAHPAVTAHASNRGGLRASRTARPLATTASCPQRLDCLAGQRGLELGNVVPKYPFERSHRFPGTRPNFSHRDYSRLSCDVGSTQFRPSAKISAGCLRGRWSSRRIAELARLPRSAAPITKIGSKGPPDRAARTLPRPNF
jgi:hypothetical protein